jgi:tetratricopeptide (TPR) repeat protein
MELCHQAKFKEVSCYLYLLPPPKRGSAKRFKGDLDGAIEDYTKIIELKPAQTFYYTAAYYNRGLAKGAKDDLDGEKADLTDALKLTPGFSEAQMRLDELHQK